MNNYYVLLDTDIKDNIDDTMSLSYLLTEKNCILNGITIVGNNGLTKAKIANSICRVSKKQVPIYIGLENTLPNEWAFSTINEDILQKYPHSDTYEGNFVDFMYATLKNNPYSVTIICIGALTNIAKLIEIYPNCTAFMKELRICAGVFSEELTNSEMMPFINQNIWSDAESAKKVFNSNINSIKVYGYEITKDLCVTREELTKKANTDLLKCIIDFADKSLNVSEPSFNDSLPSVSLFNEDICEYKKGRIEINFKERKDSPKYASTTFIEDELGNIDLCTHVNKDKFFLKLFEILSTPLNDKNLFMICNKLNEDAKSKLPEGYHFRNLKESELELWLSFPFDKETEYIEHAQYMKEYYENNYSKDKDSFFKRCTVICDKNDYPIATVLISKKDNKHTLVEWLKVKKDYENQGIGRALLTYALTSIMDKDYPLFLRIEPEDIKAIKLFSDFGFSFISKPLIINGMSNNLSESIKELQENMRSEEFLKLKQLDLSNYEQEEQK